MHFPARNQTQSHVTSHPLNKLFLSGILAEADRIPQNLKLKIEVFPLTLCLTPCERGWEAIPKVFSGLPEAQGRGDMYHSITVC